MRTEKFWVFINKKLQDGHLKKIGVYGSVRELVRDNDITIEPNPLPAQEWTVRRAIKDDRYEDDNVCIIRRRVQRTKISKKCH